MRKIGSREFKNRMGRYLRAVRKGQRLVITDRGEPVAEVIPAVKTDSSTSIIEERLKELDAQGLIHLAKRPLSKLRPIKSRGKPASQIIIEDRR